MTKDERRKVGFGRWSFVVGYFHYIPMRIITDGMGVAHGAKGVLRGVFMKPQISDYNKPSSRARATAWVRLRTFSLPKMFSMCFLTV